MTRSRPGCGAPRPGSRADPSSNTAMTNVFVLIVVVALALIFVLFWVMR